MNKLIVVLFIVSLLFSFFIWWQWNKLQQDYQKMKVQNNELQKIVSTLQIEFTPKTTVSDDPKEKYQKMITRLMEETQSPQLRLSEKKTAVEIHEKQFPTLIPVSGEYAISQIFSSKHLGLDFAASSGTPVVTAALGIVIDVYEDTYFGKVVEIDHLNGFQTRYAHLQKSMVTKKQFVWQGDRIGLVGNSGNSSAPHLHFEVVKEGNHINPEEMLQNVKE